MAWPYTPLTTYVANSTPAIKAVDLNSFQSAINYLYGVPLDLALGTVGGGQLFRWQEFWMFPFTTKSSSGAISDYGHWTAAIGGTADLEFTTGSASYPGGHLTMYQNGSVNGDAGAYTTVMLTQRSANVIATFDFEFGHDDIAITGNHFGVRNSVSGNDHYAMISADATQYGNNNYWAVWAAGGAQSTFDTGVSATNATLPDKRGTIKLYGSAVGDKIEFYINGTLEHTATTSLASATEPLHMYGRCVRVSGTGTSHEAYLGKISATFNSLSTSLEV